jgi:hypothetical protein
MSKKPGLPKLDATAFEAVAVPVPDPVQAVTRPSPPKRDTPKPVKGKAAKGQPAASSPQPPSRVGKKQLGLWLPEQTRHELKRVALDSGRTVDEIVNGLIADFLRKNTR